MTDGIISAVAGILIAYFAFDAFFWNGGIFNPSIIQRLSEATGMMAF